jgi:hypothetical protein
VGSFDNWFDQQMHQGDIIELKLYSVSAQEELGSWRYMVLTNVYDSGGTTTARIQFLNGSSSPISTIAAVNNNLYFLYINKCIINIIKASLLDDKTKKYRVGADFNEALEKVTCDIDVSYIRHRSDHSLIIDFPKLYTINNIEYYSTVILTYRYSSKGIPVIAMALPILNQQGSIIDSFKYFCVRIDNGLISDILIEYTNIEQDQLPITFIKQILKIVLYIESGDPDLTMLKQHIVTNQPHKIKAKLKSNIQLANTFGGNNQVYDLVN